MNFKAANSKILNEYETPKKKNLSFEIGNLRNFREEGPRDHSFKGARLRTIFVLISLFTFVGSS